MSCRSTLNFSRNVGETEQCHLLHLFYAGTFAHCANWLVKLTQSAEMNYSQKKFTALAQNFNF
jgi:hypothetical protein